MTTLSVREYRLSARRSGCGVSCDAGGAYIESIPLLRRTSSGQDEIWEPRRGADISADLTSRYGLPIDVASKSARLQAIAKALNASNIAYAQLLTLHLNIPSAPRGADAAHTEFVKFARELNASGLIKADWDPDQHPRWPAHAPNSQGGRFAPEDAATDESAAETASSGPGIGHNQGPPLEPIEEPPFAALGVALLAAIFLLASTSPLNDGEDEQIIIHNWHHSWPKYLGGIQDQVLSRLPKVLHDVYHKMLDGVAPRWKGKDYYDNLPPERRIDILRQVARKTKEFDAMYGTKLYDEMVRNGFPADP